MRYLQDMTREGILPRVIANCYLYMCAHCQFGKAYKRAKANNKIIIENIKHSGDLIQITQAASSVIGRWLPEYGRPSKQK